MAEDHSSWICTAMAMFLPWSILTFAVRVWTKTRSKNFGLDDYAIFAAVVAGIAHVAVSHVAIQHGYGHPMAEISRLDLGLIKKTLYAAQIFYVFSLGLCRVSASFFIAHMTYFGPQSRPAYALAAVSVFWTVVSVLAIALRGDVRRPWDTMEGTRVMYNRWIGIEATGLVIELALWMLSFNLVWGLQMRTQKRSFILGAFGARLGLVPIVGYRLAYLNPAEIADLTLDTVVPTILTEAAVNFSIIAGSLTCLKPFLRTFNPPCATERRGQSSTGGNGTRDSYLRLDTLKRRELKLNDSDDSANWRPFQGSGERHVVALPPESHARPGGDKAAPSRHIHIDSIAERRGGAPAADADATDRLVIQRTTEVSIKYEQNPKVGHSEQTE
ncbi:hypothetical protein E4U19_000266 [Claviceps sp. Clav32 group G5]|nr:hypothetical protein E4U19_000266 [Claviceps sp. Clav32 group G5]KAG6049595.1 hypothetical protein E4U39_005848 [Claviceps sp. Clav50 group G5]